jgi:acetyltransferase
VVGASRNPARIGHNLLANLVKLGFPGRIYPVHTEVREMLGLQTYPDVGAVPEAADLAVIGVPHDQAPGVLEACIARGIRRVVIVAGGFSEAGPKGRAAQEAMARMLRESGVRAIGPNALSPINARARVAVSFHPIERIKAGGLSLIFQSGLYEPRLQWLLSRFDLRLSKLIDLGNKMDVHEVDALSYLVQDSDTSVIGIHMESIEGDPGAFLRLLREGARRKRVVVLKSGRTEAGIRAAASHTGVLVRGNDALFDAALRQAGAVRVQGIEEFFDTCKALERMAGVGMRGNRVALATLPGGEGVIVTDLCEQEGLTPAAVLPQTLKRLEPVFPPWPVSGNPFDLGVCLQFNRPKEVYRLYLENVLADPQVDAVALMMSPWVANLPAGFMEAFARAGAACKPVVVWVPGMYPGGRESLTWMEDQGIPVFPAPEKALKALGALYRATRWRDAHAAEAGADPAPDDR